MEPEELRYIRKNLIKARSELRSVTNALEHLDLLLSEQEAAIKRKKASWDRAFTGMRKAKERNG